MSSPKQATEGQSIPNQVSEVRKYAEDRGWDLKFTFIEEAPATKYFNKSINKYELVESYKEIRPELSQLLAEAEKRSFKYLIVYSRDRLARVVEEHLIINAFLKKLDVKVIYLREGENCSSDSKAVNKLIDVILSSISEFETNLLSNRVKSGNKKCLLRGWWPGGRAPFGYYRVKAPDDIKEKHSILKKSNFDSKIVERIFSLYINEGLGYKLIADVMNEEYGFIIWTKSKIRSIISNNSYIGSVFWDRRGSRHNPKMHPKEQIVESNKNAENEIISSDIWNECIAIRKEREKTKDRWLLNTPFLLKHKLICGKCGEIMKTKNPGKNREMIYYCRSEECNDKRSNYKVNIPRGLIEGVFIEKMIDMFKINDIEGFRQKYEDMYSHKRKEDEDNIKEIGRMIDEIKKEVNILEAKLSSNNIKNALIREALETRKRVLSITNIEYEKVKTNLEEKIKRDKIKEEKFKRVCEMIPQCLFLQDIDKDNPNHARIRKQRRIFVLLAVDYVEIRYDKTDDILDMIIKCNFLDYA